MTTPPDAAVAFDSDAEDPNIVKDGLKEYTDYLFDSRSDLDLDSDVDEEEEGGGGGVKAWRNSRSSSQGSLSGLAPPPPLLGRPRSATTAETTSSNGAANKAADRQVNSWLSRQQEDSSRLLKPPGGGGERKVMAFHDTYSSRRAAHKMKLRNVETPVSNATKHLSLPNDLRKGGGPKSGGAARLTNWSSVDKLTKGSMTDVSHLEEDPWVLDPELVHKTASASSLSSGGSGAGGLRPRAASEMRESASSQDNLDWMVYVNRNAQDPRLLGSGRHTRKSHHSKGKDGSGTSHSTPHRSSLGSLGGGSGGHVESVYDPLPDTSALLQGSSTTGSSVSVAHSSSPGHLHGNRARSQSSAAQLSSSSSPAHQPHHHPHHWHHVSQASRAAPQWRHSLQSPPHPSVYRRRTASVDNPGSVDIIQESARMVAEMEDYMKNSPTSPASNHARFPTRFPTSLSPTPPSNVAAAGATNTSSSANRLSSGSSISTSSYDSASSEDHPDLPRISSGDDAPDSLPSMDNSSEVSSRRDRSRSGSYDVVTQPPSTPPTPQASSVVSGDSGRSPTGSATPTQVSPPSSFEASSSSFSPSGKDAYHASSPTLSPPPESAREHQAKSLSGKEGHHQRERSTSLLKLAPRVDVFASHLKEVLTAPLSPVTKPEEREKRELQSVLRSRELGSSAIGSRIAHSDPAPITIPTPPLSPPSSSSDSAGPAPPPLARPRSACCGDAKTGGAPAPKSAYDYLAKEASPDSPARFSLPPPAHTPGHPEQHLSPLQQSDSGFSMQSDVTDSCVGEEVTSTAACSSLPSPRGGEESGVAEGEEEEEEEEEEEAVPPSAKGRKKKKKRRGSHSSGGSVDSIYERRFSEALEPGGVFRDSAVFCDLDSGSKSPSVCEEEALLPRRSIRELVQVLEERSRQRQARPQEVKRRPAPPAPGRGIQQRLQTLVQAAQYRGPREGSLSRGSSQERDAPTRSVRDIQASLLPRASSPSPASFAPAPQQQQPLPQPSTGANQFVHRRPRVMSAQQPSPSGSPLTRSSSNVGSRPSSMCGTGSLRAAKSLGRLDQLGGPESEGAVIMKGWVQQLISRFQTDAPSLSSSSSSKERSMSPGGATTSTTTSTTPATSTATSTASIDLAH